MKWYRQERNRRQGSEKVYKAAALIPFNRALQIMESAERPCSSIIRMIQRLLQRTSLARLTMIYQDRNKLCRVDAVTPTERFSVLNDRALTLDRPQKRKSAFVLCDGCCGYFEFISPRRILHGMLVRPHDGEKFKLFYTMLAYLSVWSLILW